jgi:hypothetical protein
MFFPPRFEYHIFYVLYIFVIYILTLPRIMTLVLWKLRWAPYPAEIYFIYSCREWLCPDFQVLCCLYIGNFVTNLYLSLTVMHGVEPDALRIPGRKDNGWDPSRGVLNVMLVRWRILSQYCHDLGVVWLIRRVLDWMIGFIGTLFIQLGTTGNYIAIADLHTLQFTVSNTIEFSVFTSRILATDL